MSIRPTDGGNGGFQPIQSSGDGDSDSVNSVSSNGSLGSHSVSSRGGSKSLCARIATAFRNCFSRSSNRSNGATTVSQPITQADIHHPTLSGQGTQAILSTGDAKVDSAVIHGDLRAQNTRTVATHIQSKLKSMEKQSSGNSKAGAYNAVRYTLFTPGGTSVSSQQAHRICIRGRDLWQQSVDDLGGNENTDGLMMLSCLCLGGRQVPTGQLREFMEGVRDTFTDEGESVDPTTDDILDLAAQIDAAELSEPGSKNAILDYLGNCGKATLDNDQVNRLVLDSQEETNPQQVRDNSQEIQRLLGYAQQTDPVLFLQTVTALTSDIFFEGGESVRDPFDY